MHPNESLINEFVDQTLTAIDRVEVERHLEGCSQCRALVADLREVRRAAAALEAMEPPARAWQRIASELQSGARHAESWRSITASSYYPWLATAAVLMLASGVAFWLGPLGRPAQSPGAVSSPSPLELARSVESELRQAEEHYDKAIRGLEQIAAAEKGALDPNTAATLQKNLAVIDQAINESRAALRTQPNSEPAQQSLLDGFKTKLGVLQDTVALINEMRKGNEAGAARIVSGLKQKG